MPVTFEIETETSCNSINNLEDTQETIEIIDSKCSYDAFFYSYMKPNIPCIIEHTGTTWKAYKYWTHENEPNLSYLNEKYGQSSVIVYDCNERYYNSQNTQCSVLQDYINNWFDMKKKLYYIKDWHLQKEFPSDRFYEVPVFFASDWLNEYLCEKNEDDYRFVYMGPTGTWTPFHADVFTSFSWSINICGQKRWILLPRSEENKLKDELGNLPYDLTSLSLENCKHFEIIQNPNEAIFVPSGWYHQVWNTKDTISINHNWINGCNIKAVWQSLVENLTAVVNEIDDCKDMDNFAEHCQVMLKASYGIDFAKFYDFLKYIAVKRINQLASNVPVISFEQYELGRRHAIFDLKSIKDVLELFLQHPVNKSEISNDFNPSELYCDVNKCIDNIIA